MSAWNVGDGRQNVSLLYLNNSIPVGQDTLLKVLKSLQIKHNKICKFSTYITTDNFILLTFNLILLTLHYEITTDNFIIY